MKKLIRAAICLILIFVCGTAWAVEYTLPEKMNRQLEIGSGLKGSFVLQGEGSGPMTDAMRAFFDAEIQVRGIASGEDLHYYFYQTDETETQWAKTETYRKDGAWYVRSDMLDGKVYYIPSTEDLADSLAGNAGDNPPFLSAVWKLLNISSSDMEEKWLPALKRYEDGIEMWLPQFAGEPVTRREDGSTLMDLTYTIPVESLKAGILSIISQAAADEQLTELMKTVMTDEQMAAYFNPDLMYFYEQALNSLDLGYDVQLTRTMTTMGDVRLSTVELPLDAERTGFSSLSMENSNGLTSYTLTGEDRTITLVMSDTDGESKSFNTTFWLNVTGETDGEQEVAAVRCDIKKTVTETEDDDSRQYETDAYTITVTGDDSTLTDEEEALPRKEIGDTEITAELIYSSKYAQSSPTNLAFDITVNRDSEKLRLRGSVKTASPWMFAPFSIEGAESLMDMGQDDAAVVAAQWLLNTAASLKANYTEPEEETAAEGIEGQQTEDAAPGEADDSEAGPEDAGEPSEGDAGETADGMNEGTAEAGTEDAARDAGEEETDDTTESAGEDASEDMTEEAGGEGSGEA